MDDRGLRYASVKSIFYEHLSGPCNGNVIFAVGETKKIILHDHVGLSEYRPLESYNAMLFFFYRQTRPVTLRELFVCFEIARRLGQKKKKNDFTERLRLNAVAGMGKIVCALMFRRIGTSKIQTFLVSDDIIGLSTNTSIDVFRCFKHKIFP